MTRAGRERLLSAPVDHVALIVFAAYIAIALPLILFSLGDERWFFGDEWSFLAERDAGDLGDLFRSHGEHWTTIPVVGYRVLFNLFGLRSYVPYQCVVVVAHLTTAVLLRVIMRRAGVRPWTATIVASVFVLFGPGEENIVWAFQIGFVGAVMFGLVQLVLSDHDGPIAWRDGVALLAGAASLMCSGVSLVMVAVVGLAVMIRRGWKPAALQAAPLALMYGIWYLVTDPGGIENPYGRGPEPDEVARFSWSGVRGTFEAIAGVDVLALVLAAVALAGVVLTARHFGTDERRRLAVPYALAVGAGVFLVGTVYTRWFVTPTADSQSRYLYTTAAFLLPAMAVCADALIRRWRVAAPFVLGLFVLATIVNVGKFGDRPPFDDDYQRVQRELITSMAYSDAAGSVPGYVRPNVWFTVGWLRSVAAAGDIPEPARASADVDRRIRDILAVTQIRETPAKGRECERVRAKTTTTIWPRAGQRYSFAFANKPAVGSNFFTKNSILVTPIENGRAAAPLPFSSEFGRTLEVEADDLALRVQPADPTQTLILCRLERDQVERDQLNGRA
jgi:hypothetical protein